MTKKDQTQELTLISLKNFLEFTSATSKQTGKQLQQRADNAMQFLSDVETMLPRSENKIRLFNELSRRIYQKAHMDEAPMLSTIKLEVVRMIDELTPKKPERFYFVKRIAGSVWTCEYMVITRHQIQVLTWSRNNDVGYEHEKELPKGRLIETEIDDVPRTVVGAEIDGKIFEVINPAHALNFTTA